MIQSISPKDSCSWMTAFELIGWMNDSLSLTFQEFRNHLWIGWIILDFWETRVSHSLTFHLETKMSWRQTFSRKKKAIVFITVTMSSCQYQLNAGFSKVCEKLKVCSIESLKYVWQFYTPVCFCGDISTVVDKVHRSSTWVKVQIRMVKYYSSKSKSTAFSILLEWKYKSTKVFMYLSKKVLIDRFILQFYIDYFI